MPAMLAVLSGLLAVRQGDSARRSGHAEHHRSDRDDP
jgi:hypothetical protein